MKTLIAGWSCVVVAAAILGCSESHRSKVSESSSQGSHSEAADAATAKANQDAKTDDMTPEQLGNLLRGSNSSAPAATPKPEPAPLAEGTIALKPNLTASVPKGWVPKQPRSGIIEHEFTVPAAEGDSQPGRVTVMVAGGSIDANVQRWYGQFTQPDGSKTADRAKSEQKEIAGHKVHLVDISGTYGESMGGGPFAPGEVVQRPGYRMLAAIIETSAGNYFIKFYGPEKTVASQAAAFRQMIDGLAAR